MRAEFPFRFKGKIYIASQKVPKLPKDAHYAGKASGGEALYYSKSTKRIYRSQWKR